MFGGVVEKGRYARNSVVSGSAVAIAVVLRERYFGRTQPFMPATMIGTQSSLPFMTVWPTTWI